jgi:hypothetical protein
MAKINDEDLPSNDKSRKPTAKKVFDLNNYKKKANTEDVPDKPLEWIKISDALEDVTGMPGFPKGYVSTCCGFSNSGKSTAIALGIVNAQKMGILPIIIDLENNLGRYRLTSMGFDWTKPYIIIDNEYLLTEFGDKTRSYASIEDFAACVRYFLKEQTNGDLPYDILFAIDSIGTLDCNKKINAAEKNEVDSNFWNAGAYEKEFKYLFNDVIPNSRKVNKPYTNTVIAVQKIGRDAMNNAITMNGGKMWEYTPRLQYYFGGILTKGVAKVTAISKKREVSYGVSVKVNILKNHIDGPLGGISMEGKIISVPQGFITTDGIEEYKKKNILYFRNVFNNNDLTADEITTGNRIEDDKGKLMYDLVEDEPTVQ